MPGPGDVLFYYWEKDHVGAWLKKNALPILEKYGPVIVKWEQNYEKARNLDVAIYDCATNKWRGVELELGN